MPFFSIFVACVHLKKKIIQNVTLPFSLISFLYRNPGIIALIVVGLLVLFVIIACYVQACRSNNMLLEHARAYREHRQQHQRPINSSDSRMDDPMECVEINTGEASFIRSLYDC